MYTGKRKIPTIACLSNNKMILIYNIIAILNFIQYYCLHRDTLREVIQLVRNTSSPQVEVLTRIMKKWAKDNKLQV